MSLRKKSFVGLLLLGLLGGQLLHGGDLPHLLSIEKAYAVDPAPIQDAINGMATGFSLASSAMNFLTFILIYMADRLVDPGFATGTIMDMETVLHDMWRTSRDITNIILAFMLLVGAAMTVIMAQGNYVQTYFMRFVVAIILVNFSWWFPRVIIDVANVLTASILQLPGRPQCNKKVCQKIATVKVFTPDCDGDSPLGEMDNKHLVCITKKNVDQKLGGILNGLYVNNLKIENIAKVPLEFAKAQALQKKFVGPPAPGAPGVGQMLILFIRAAFSIFVQAAILFPLAAIVAAFTVRIAILWMTIAFMPFMFIGFVGGDKMGSMNTMDLIFKKFLASAFLPVLVAIPLSLGFMMINTAVGPAFVGPVHPDDFIGNLIPGVVTLNDLVWYGLSVFIIWTGVFMALQSDKSYTAIGNTVSGVGKAWMGVAIKAPLAVPFIPGKEQQDSSGRPIIGPDGRPKREYLSPLQLGRIARYPQGLIPSTGRFGDDRTPPPATPGTPALTGAQIGNAVNNNRPHQAQITNNITQIMNGGPGSRANLDQLRRTLAQGAGVSENQLSNQDIVNIINRMRSEGVLANNNSTALTTAQIDAARQ